MDSDHVDHGRAHEWLDAEVGAGWASCPITENGFVRIISQLRYPSPVPPNEAIDLLRHACADEYHQRWPCDVSLLDERVVDPARIHGPRQVTDAYLLALAVRHDGRFVTFDQSVSIEAVVGARPEHIVVL